MTNHDLALEGHYGDYHATPRTQYSKLWINPLMPVYWCFIISAVAERLLYHEAMKETETFDDVNGVIKNFRSSLKNIRPKESIPA